MSFLALDTKGDLARNYGTIAQKYYGYRIAVIDLRNPTRSGGNNLLTLINRYMDKARADEKDLASRAKAEKYAKILSKTIINPSDDTDHGQNAFFYDAAEGLLTSVFLLMAEFLPPVNGYGERRHIPSVFKLVQELLEPSRLPGKSNFQLLMGMLPSDHKARWFAGAALNAALSLGKLLRVSGVKPRLRRWIFLPALCSAAGTSPAALARACLTAS